MQNETKSIGESVSALVNPLCEVRKRVRRRGCVLAVVHGVGVFAAGVLALAGVARYVPIREGFALAAVSVLAAFGVGVMIRGVVLAVLRQPSLASLAAAVELARPELMDVFACALEQCSLPDDQRSAFGTLAIERAVDCVRGVDFAEILTPKALRTSQLAGVFVLFVCLTGLAVRSNPVRKTIACLSGNPGIVVQPGDTERPLAADVTVTGQVRRWEHVAEIEFEDAGGQRRFPMNGDGAVQTFTFYGVDAPVRYRVVTPSLVSPWYHVSVYQLPEIESFRLDVMPPDYTGLSLRRREEPGDVTAVAGSRVRFELGVPEGVSAAWVPNGAGEAVRFDEPSGEARVAAFLLDKTMEGRIRLRDDQGHESRTAVMRLEALPDLPPTVDVLAPEQDGHVSPDAALAMEALATDDFGVARVTLQYAVSGADRQEVDLFGGPAQLEKTVSHAIDVADLEAEAGDVITGFFTVEDNRRPGGQRARSEVFFVEVRPELEARDPSEMQGEGQKKQEVDINRLIAETKRLIRLSYDLGGRAKPASDVEIRPLLTGLEDLQTSLVQLADKTEKLMRAAGKPAGNGFLRSLEKALGRAIRLARARLIEESIPHQERTLSGLLRLAQELRRNAMSSGHGQGEKSAGQPKGTESDESRDGERGRQSLGQRLESLRELMAEAAELGARQKALNERVRKVRDAEISAAERAELAERQGALRRRAGELSGRLTAGSAREAEASVQAAGESMGRAEGNLRGGNMPGALRGGLRAHARLLAASEHLREAMRRAAGAELNALAEFAQSLADRQRSAAERSRELAANPPDLDALDSARAQQEQDATSAGALVDRMEQLGGELAETFPRAAQTLGDAATQARDERLGRGMKRAANALLYSRFGRAAEGQSQAAARLGGLAGALRDGTGQLPNVGQRELVEALQRLRGAREALKRAAGARDRQEARRQVDETAPEMARLMQRFGRELGEPGLGNLALLMESMDPNRGAGERAQYAAGLLDRAGGIIERYIARESLRQAYRISRESTDVPQRYRRAVEDYFRNLSEGE